MAVKRLLILFGLLLAIDLVASAQSWQPAAGIQSITAGSALSLASDKNSSKSSFLSGRVIVTQGIPLPQPAAIESNCDGHLRTEAYTDAKGYFTFQLSERSGLGPEAGQSFGVSSSLPLCELQASLPGFISEKIQLSGNSDSAGIIRVGDIIVRPATRADGNMISVTSVAAPSKAQKNFLKGCEQANQGKWKAAAERFREAVRIYPKYAQAWVFLGKVEAQQGDLEAARQSFHDALTADPKFVDAYTELAQLALRAKQWQELADDTDQILQLDPAGMPQFWYLNSAANYELKKVDKAEKSALQGVRLDVRQRIPQLQYLLAAILTLKQDYRGAAEHIRHYLRLAPHAQDAAVAQQQLQQLEKLSGAAE